MFQETGAREADKGDNIMYVSPNYKTKKALKADFHVGEKITVFSPGPFPLKDGPVSLEGPHYPKPHRWYASGICKNGILIQLED